jgi:hypothetical protein
VKTRTKKNDPPAVRPRKLRLAIEPVPQSSWYRELGRVFPEAEWKTLREVTLAEAGNRCAICGSAGPLRVDAAWEYDDRRRLQRLIGFRALCARCWALKNYSFTEESDRQEGIPLPVLERHFLQVNLCRRATLEAHRREARAVWRRRSRFRWTADLSEKQAVLERAPKPYISGDWIERMRGEQDAREQRDARDGRVLQKWVKIHDLPPKHRRPYQVPELRRVHRCRSRRERA